jgi:hypothetical protein
MESVRANFPSPSLVAPGTRKGQRVGRSPTRSDLDDCCAILIERYKSAYFQRFTADAASLHLRSTRST